MNPPRGGIAMCLALLFVWLGLLFVSRGDIMEITVIGDPGFTHGANEAWFGFEPNPAPYIFRVQYDTEAPDGDPGPNGRYVSEGLPATLTFGDFRFSTIGTVVFISVEDGEFSSISFGSAHPFAAHGLDLPERGLFSAFLDYSQSLIPSDDLSWLEHYGGSALFSGSLAEVLGDVDGVFTLYHDTDVGIYTVAPIPEVHPVMLCALGCLVLAGFCRR